MDTDNQSEKKSIIAPVGKNPLDWIFILRPVLHPPVWTILILGFYQSPVRPVDSFRIIWLILISSGLAGWAYIVNQISDIESDRRNNKLFFLPSGLISIRAASILAGSLTAISLSAAFFINISVGLVSSALIILGYLYSGKPFYGKNHPVWGTLLNGFGHGSLVFMLGFSGSGGYFGDAFPLSIPYLFAVIAVFIGTSLPDTRGDALSGKRTPGVVLGVRFSTAVMALSLMIGLLLSLIFQDIPMLIVCNLCMPFYLYAAIRPKVKNAVFAVRLSVLLLSLAACFIFPWYLLILAFLFVTARLYHKKRFGIDYPSLSL
ncbi:MAG: UbiA family prenyltransferase [candidate division Zixibacteria bacterium]